MKRNKLTDSFAPGKIIMLVFVVYTIALKLIDVDSIGPENSEVGFSAVNGFFRDLIGYSGFWYTVSKIFTIGVYATVAAFVLMAVMQFFQRKSILKIDKNLISLVLFYVTVIGLYLFFEVVVINCRPIIRDKGLEASFPSTHTMLAMCVMGSAVIQFKKYLRDLQKRRIASIIAVFIGGMVILARFLSGVHWFSDILGGIILSAAMLLLYNTAFNIIERANSKTIKQ
ncbi:MAG: phosphatase PAP2 family protein [Porcipelethomonas sp.]